MVMSWIWSRLVQVVACHLLCNYLNQRWHCKFWYYVNMTFPFQGIQIYIIWHVFIFVVLILMLWYRKCISPTKLAEKLPCTIRGLNSQHSDWGTIPSCQLASTFIPRHRDCPQKDSSYTYTSIHIIFQLNFILDQYIWHMHIEGWNPFHKHGLTSILTWIRNQIHYKVWDEITYPFSNFNSCTVEVWEWVSYFIPYFTEHVTIHRCRDLS